jgi:hypothetical protein
MILMCLNFLLLIDRAELQVTECMRKEVNTSKKISALQIRKLVNEFVAAVYPYIALSYAKHFFRRFIVYF